MAYKSGWGAGCAAEVMWKKSPPPLRTPPRFHSSLCRIQMSHKDRKVRMASSTVPVCFFLVYCKNTQQAGGEKRVVDWSGRWAMGRSKQQLLGQSSFVHFSFFLFLHMENLIEVTHRSRTSWMPGQKCHWSRPITMAQSLPHPPLLQPLWARSRHQQTLRMDGPGLRIFLLFGWFFVSVCPKKKPSPRLQHCVCIFIVYIIDEFADNKSQSNVKKVTGRNVRAMDRPRTHPPPN